MTETNYYFEVIAKCGHVGRNRYVPIKFAIEAKNGKEAAKIARQIPRVKHHQKYAILSVNRIDYDRYQEIRIANNNDPYLKCHSKQEQNLIENFDERIIVDLHNQKTKENRQDRFDRVAYKLKKNRILEKLSMEELLCL